MTKKDKEELHKIALKHVVIDEVAKLVVESPFLFMKKTIEELDLEELDKTNFYHKGLGRFYLKEKVLEHIKNNSNNGRKRKKKH